MLDELYRRFPAWLEKNLADNPLKCEYFLPSVANAVIKNGEGSVCVLNCREKWYGMTYKEDMQSVTSSIRKLRCDGIYPEKLLD